MKNLLLCILLLSATLSACNTDNEILSLDTIPARVVAGRPFETIPELLAPRQIYTTAGAIALFDTDNKGGFLSFFDKQTGALHRSWGIEGRGPGEFILPRVVATQKSLTVTSIGGDFRKVGFTDSLEVTPLNITYVDKLIGSNFLFVVDDSRVVSVKEGPDQLQILNPRTGEEEYTNYYPMKMPGKIDPVTLNSTVFQAHYAYHEDSGRMFVAYQYQPIASVVDITGDGVVGETRFDSFRNNIEKNERGGWGYSDPVLGYTFTAVSDNYFYALYQGTDRKTLRANTQKSEIHKYDLSGRLIERVIINKPIYHFSVERDDSKLYALFLDDEFIAKAYVFDI